VSRPNRVDYTGGAARRIGIMMMMAHGAWMLSGML
jgi:hypothetical protein